MAENQLLQELSEQSKQIAILEEELQSLKRHKGHGNTGDKAHDEGLSPLEEENIKLKYRIGHLEQSLSKARKLHETHSTSAHAVLSAFFDYAIQAAFPQLFSDPSKKLLSSNLACLTPSVQEAFGDYQCNAAMGLAKRLKEVGVNLAPVAVAEKIVAHLPSHTEFIDKVAIAGPGFINVFLSRAFVATEIRRTLLHGSVLPPKSPYPAKRVIVDYSSPNVAKEMHVGHLRSTIIGDCISRLCEYLGHSVLRLNHIGDWGTQFGMLIAHLKDVFPSYETQTPPIGDLQNFYKASKKRFDEDPAFKERAYQAVVQLQRHEPSSIKGWRLICDASKKEFDAIYARLAIGNLVERGESFYQDRMVQVVDELKKKNLLLQEEGRWIMWPRSEGPEKSGSPPLTVVKSDGGFTYDTSDLAALKQRVEEEHGEWIIYVVDSGQSVHLKGVFDGAIRAGWVNPQIHRVDHVGFGVVLGEDKKKLKTRSGETVRLVDLLNEGLAKSLERLKEKERDKVLTPEELKAAQEAVAYGCIKYADLSHNRTNDYTFSFARMLDDKGNTAVYLLYMYTRIRSIARNANISPEQLRQAAKTEPLKLEHPNEWKLAKCLTKFPDVVLKMQEDLLIHPLCDYLYELSAVYSEFYDNCYCIEKNSKTGETKVNMWRILLCEATATFMRTGFDILGLKYLEKM